MNSLFDLSDPHAYDKAMNLLGQRYESSFLIIETYRDKLDNWLKLQPNDGISLRKYSDFLKQCLIAMDTVKGLGILNDCRENRKMLLKLPEYLILRWSRKIAGLTDYPEFKIYVQFITEEADILCNPITNFTYLDADSKKKGMQSRESFATDTEEEHRNKCSYCNKNNHSIHACYSFMEKRPEERSEYIKKKGLCLQCLKKGHVARTCTMRSI